MTKTVMITGAGSGFGKGASLALADRGTTGQMDPAEVVTRMVELTEAETTTENNFVPPEILGTLGREGS